MQPAAGEASKSRAAEQIAKRLGSNEEDLLSALAAGEKQGSLPLSQANR